MREIFTQFFVDAELQIYWEAKMSNRSISPFFLEKNELRFRNLSHRRA